MAEPALAPSVTAEILSSLPQAVDPRALSLNESPFPPLPAVRSALVHCLDVANRYPEFLPEQLRRMIGDRLGLDEEQVVLGTGASGVAMQVLHAVTRPGDRIVFSTPTFDGHRPARPVRLPGSDGNGRGGDGRARRGVVPTAQSDRNNGIDLVGRMVTRADPR
jgi:aspartate/methionine/tyrosine aminotransferase